MKEYRKALLRELDRHADRAEPEERIRLGSLLARIREERTTRRTRVVSWPRLATVTGLATAAVVVFVWSSFQTHESMFEPPHRAVASREPVANFSGRWQAGEEGPVGTGRTLQVPQGSSAQLEIGPKSRVWIGEGAGFAVPTQSAERLVLLRGRVLVWVDPAERRSLVVESPVGSVHVHGTLFSVEVEEGTVSVRLYRGAVEFVQGERERVHALSAGEALEVGGDAGLAVRRRRLNFADAFWDLDIGGWDADSPSGRSAFPDLLSMTGVLYDNTAPPKNEARPSRRSRPPRGIVKTVDEQATIGEDRE